VEPLNSNRHKYLAKRTSVFPAINLGRMNSMMRVVKSKVLQHFENDLDPTNLSIMMDKQLENLNTRLETYKKEYQTLKEREERELSGYNLEIQIKKADFDIKEQIAKNQELKRSNQGLIKQNQKMHTVSHHRVTIDDDSQYTLAYKQNKSYLERILAKSDYLQVQLLKMAESKDREA
jgi:hypothetical protein